MKAETMEKSLIDSLQELGLNRYEAKVYLALLERDALTTGDVATISGVPRARTYDILESLVSKGLASLKPGKCKKYSGADIDTYKGKLIVDIEKTAVALKRKFETIFRPTDLTSNPLEYIEVIKEPGLASTRFLDLSAKAKHDIISFVKGPFTGDREKLQEQIKAQCERAKRNHLTARVIYEIKDDSDKWIFEFIDLAVRHAGEEARILRNIPVKACIFDEKTIMLALPDPIISKVSFTTMIIVHCDLARALKVSFNALWEQAEDYNVFRD